MATGEPSEPSTTATAEAGTRWPPMLVLAAVCLVLVAVPWTFKLTMGQALGQPCGGGFDCQVPDGRCVEGEQGRFCTRVCERDDECPAEGHCGVPSHDRWQVWFSASAMSERVCVPGPRPATPPRAGDMPTAPGAEGAGAQFRPPEQRGGLRNDRP